MLKEWLDKAGAEGKALVDAYREVDRPPCGRARPVLRRAAGPGGSLSMVGLLVMVLRCPSSAGCWISTCPAPTPTPAT